ncbi:MAG TPA: hypothetical protein VHC69_22015 [Polyangiaceae bacterium]|nr:hypothetical protein [Polyangiaceae bacterium]
MEQQEFEEDVETCADCGAAIAPDADASFPFGENRALCFECATRRRGEYDEREDKWIVAPDLTGLEPFEGEA